MRAPAGRLGAVDAEAARRGTSRSAVLQAGARHELGLVAGEERVAVLAELDDLSRRWHGPVDAAALVRSERHRKRTRRRLLSADDDLLAPGLAVGLGDITV